MLDHRKEARKKVIRFTPVYKLQPKTLLGYLVDLNLRGAKVEGERAAEINQQVTLSIEFPSDLPEVPSAPFTIPARVARCVSGEGPTFYNLGFEFTDITPEQTRIIEAIIRRYAFGKEMSE
jgi:hypothetical protein